MTNDDLSNGRTQYRSPRAGRRKVLRGLSIGCASLLGLTGTSVADDDAGLTAEEEKRTRRLIEKVENSRNPEQVMAEMPKEDRELVKKAIQIRAVRVEQSIGSMSPTVDREGSVSPAATCLTVTTELIGSSYLGDQWGYFVETDFCFDGTNVTQADWRRYAQVYSAFWHFDGHIGLDESGQVGTSYYQVWTQGEFHSSFSGSEMDTAYPWIEQTFYGDGTWNGDGDHGECSNC